MFPKPLTAILILLVMMLSACGDDNDNTAAVQGSNPQQESTPSQSSQDAESTPSPPSPTTVSISNPNLPPSIINPSNVANVVERFETGEAVLYSYSWSPDSQLLVANTSRGVRLYDSREPNLPPRIFEDYREFAAISPDGTQAISRTPDNETVVWNVLSGEPNTVLDTDTLLGIPQFSPNSQVIAAIQDNMIQVWDAADGTPLDTIDLGVEVIYELFYRDDGVLLSLAYDGTTTALWDVVEKKIICEIGDFSLAQFAQASISANGHVLAVPIPNPNNDNPNYTSYEIVQVWDTRSGENIRRIRSGGLPTLTPDGTGYLYHNYGRSLVIRDLESDLDRSTIELPSPADGFYAVPTNITMSPDSATVAGMDYSGKIFLFDVETSALHQISDFGSYVTTLDFNQASTTLLMSTNTGHVTLWDIETGELLKEAVLPDISGIYFLPDESQLISVGGNVFLIDAESLERGDFIMASNSSSAALSPDGTLLAMLEYNYDQIDEGMPARELMVWNLERDAPQFSNLPMPEAQYTERFSFSPDGRYILLTSDNTHAIIDVQTGLQHNSLSMDDIEYTTAIFHPDGENLMLVTLDNETIDNEIIWHSTLWAWSIDGDEAQLLAEFDGASITDMAYTPDGSILALGGQWEDGGVAFWDTATQEIIATVGNPEQGARSLDFTPDGSAFIFKSSDNFVHVWGLDD